MPLFQYSRLTGTLPRAATLRQLYLPINKSNNKQLLLPPFSTQCSCAVLGNVSSKKALSTAEAGELVATSPSSSSPTRSNNNNTQSSPFPAFAAASSQATVLPAELWQEQPFQLLHRWI